MYTYRDIIDPILILVLCPPCGIWAVYASIVEHRTDKIDAKFCAALESESDKLCWACTEYFDFDGASSKRQYPFGLTQKRWREGDFTYPLTRGIEGHHFGTYEAISDRAERCQCCKLLDKDVLPAVSRWTGENFLLPARSSFGYWINIAPSIDALLRHRNIYFQTPLYLLEPSETSEYSTHPGDVHFVSETINWDVAKRWLHHCAHSHGTSCGMGWDYLWQTVPDMRVVDVQDMSIVWPAPLDCKYAVLSYTWGGVQKTKIDSPTQKKIDLKPYYKKLPRTIRDAITVTRNMGLRYLWADALCIQSRVKGTAKDEEADEAKQFGDMHIIYGRATFCIVAAQGRSAEDGLRGVSGNADEGGCNPEPYSGPSSNTPVSARVLQARADIGRKRYLVKAIPLPGDISRSEWASRAWCLQEQLFSTRYLVFYDNQVWFQCKQGMWFEDMPLHLKPDRSSETTPQYEDSQERREPWKAPVLARISEITVNISKVDIAKTKGQYRSDSDEVTLPFFEEYKSIFSLYSNRTLTYSTDALRASAGLLSFIKAGMRTEMLSGLPESMLDEALLWKARVPLCRRGLVAENPDDVLPSWSWAGWTGSIHYEKEPLGLRSFVTWFKAGEVINPDVAQLEDRSLRLPVKVNRSGVGIRVEGDRRPEEWKSASETPGFKNEYEERPLRSACHPSHLQAWTMYTTSFKLASISDGIECYLENQTRIVGECCLDEGWQTDNITRREKLALVIISEARYFSDERLNTEMNVYDWPEKFLLYNVILVEFLQDGTAARKGVGRVSKLGWGTMKPEWKCVCFA